jgi:DNA polymerase I-like protein with 3'-5' exonuclease and polymerase domains
LGVLVNIDVKGLEWVTVVWFAQDKVGMREIITGVDQHAENQKTFGLPERRIAKIFVFRLIYGGSKWAYALDPDFNYISKSPDYWQKVIDRFYEKYAGIARQHAAWIREATTTSGLVMPTGRRFEFHRYQNKRGEWEWPRTQILNYPVQGTGHDIVSIIRVSLYRRIKDDPVLRDRCVFVSTVHDSIVIDFNGTKESEQFIRLVSTVNSVFRDVPDNWRRLFGVELNLPIQGEISCGPNLLDKVVI